MHKWDRNTWFRKMRAHDKFQRMAEFYKEMKFLVVQKDNDIFRPC